MASVKPVVGIPLGHDVPQSQEPMPWPRSLKHSPSSCDSFFVRFATVSRMTPVARWGSASHDAYDTSHDAYDTATVSRMKPVARWGSASHIARVMGPSFAYPSYESHDAEGASHARHYSYDGYALESYSPMQDADGSPPSHDGDGDDDDDGSPRTPRQRRYSFDGYALDGYSPLMGHEGTPKSMPTYVDVGEARSNAAVACKAAVGGALPPAGSAETCSQPACLQSSVLPERRRATPTACREGEAERARGAESPNTDSPTSVIRIIEPTVGTMEAMHQSEASKALVGSMDAAATRVLDAELLPTADGSQTGRVLPSSSRVRGIGAAPQSAASASVLRLQPLLLMMLMLMLPLLLIMLAQSTSCLRVLGLPIYPDAAHRERVKEVPWVSMSSAPPASLTTVGMTAATLPSQSPQRASTRCGRTSIDDVSFTASAAGVDAGAIGVPLARRCPWWAIRCRWRHQRDRWQTRRRKPPVSARAAHRVGTPLADLLETAEAGL